MVMPQTHSFFTDTFLSLVLVCLLVGCGTNPVTGKTEVQLVSEEQEIELGKENYFPAQQSQGGAYNVEPGVQHYVSRVGKKLAKVSDRPDLPYEFVVINNSVPNAWALPGGKIAINRGLLIALDNEAQLAAVLAHEIVHAAARHGAKNVERGLLYRTGLGLLDIGVGGTYGNVIVGSSAVGLQLLNLSYTREAEREADYYGMQMMSEAGYDPQEAVALQEIFLSLANQGESNWLEGLFATHPPSQERIAANRETATTLPRGGYIGASEYQKEIAGVKADEPAYQDLTQGYNSLNQRNYSRANQLAQQAISIEPREGKFYALQGDTRYLQKDYQAAVAAYTEAIKRNDAYYYFYLQRGLAYQKVGENDKARRDLDKSNELLPNATAHYMLGEIAAAQGRRNDAIAHYELVANSSSALRGAAQEALRDLGAY